MPVVAKSITLRDEASEGGDLGAAADEWKLGTPQRRQAAYIYVEVFLGNFREVADKSARARKEGKARNEEEKGSM